MEADPTCFGLQRNHHHVLCTVQAYACTVHNTRATLCRHSTNNVCTTSISTPNQTCNFS